MVIEVFWTISKQKNGRFPLFQVKFQAFLVKNGLVFSLFMVPNHSENEYFWLFKLPKHAQARANHSGIQLWSFWAFKPPKNGFVFTFLVRKFPSQISGQFSCSIIDIDSIRFDSILFDLIQNLIQSVGFNPFDYSIKNWQFSCSNFIWQISEPLFWHEAHFLDFKQRSQTCSKPSNRG